MYRNQKIRFRILLGYSIPLLLIILTSAGVYLSLKSYEKAHEQTTRSIATFDKSNEMDLISANLQLYSRGYVLHKNDTSLKNYNETKRRYEEVSQFLVKFNRDEQQILLHARVMEKTKEIIELSDRLISLVDQGRKTEALNEFINRNLINFDLEITKLNIAFDDKEKQLLSTAQKEQAIALGYIGYSLIIGISLTLVFSIIGGLMITNGITKHVSSAINAMASTSTEIAATVSQHERTASQQASMVNETTTTIQELSVSSRQTSEQAFFAAEVAQNALKATEKGAVIVKQAINGMNSLGAKVGMIADQTLKLGEQTAQIGNLANMVKDLSGEINMLALNAAVEAARAGEHGKGFAVVAGEVRKLASESKKSAEQANAVVSDIQKATNATILKTEEGTKVVEEVTGYAENVGELFDSLSEAANKIYENAQQVLLNTKQQSTALGQIVEAMNGLNTGARETAAGIVQTKTGIGQLNSAAGSLKQIL